MLLDICEMESTTHDCKIDKHVCKDILKQNVVENETPDPLRPQSPNFHVTNTCLSYVMTGVGKQTAHHSTYTSSTKNANAFAGGLHDTLSRKTVISLSTLEPALGKALVGDMGNRVWGQGSSCTVFGENLLNNLFLKVPTYILTASICGWSIHLPNVEKP